MKKQLVLTAFVLLMIFSVTGFEASISPQKKTANSTSPASYNLNIQNTGVENNSYSISMLSPKSSWFYYPNTVNVPSGENRTVEISATPPKNAVQQRYRFETTIRESSTGEIRRVSDSFRVEQPYRIEIIGLGKNKEEFRPGEVVETEIRIVNLDNQPIRDYEVIAFFKNETRTESGTTILPGAERLYEFKYRVDEKESPGKININYRVIADGKTEREAKQEITVSEIENITRTVSKDNKIFLTTERNKVENKGNAPVQTTITAEVPSYLASITTAEPRPDQKEDVGGNKVYTWNVELEPGEEYTVRHTTKYWIPVTGIILITLGLAAIKRIGSEVSLIKTAEASEGEVKINIEIKNTSEKTYEELELEEFIPDIAKVDEKFDMNTPKIQETNQGTRLTWKIKELEPGDQRIIQYKIKPKVDVEEKVELKPAVLKDRNGQQIKKSNKTETEFTS